MSVDQDLLKRCGMNVILPSRNLSTSTAKQRYSFSKAERFPSYNKKNNPLSKSQQLKDNSAQNQNPFQIGVYPKKGDLPIYKSYNPIQINKDGKYPLSFIPNVSTVILHKKDENDKIYEKLRKVRELEREKIPPREPIKILTDKEKLAKWEEEQKAARTEAAKKGVSFLRRYKEKEHGDNYPGPGSYGYLSDFGMYLSSDWQKYPTANVYEDDKPKQEVDPRPWRHGMKIIKEEPPVEEYNDNNDYKEEEPKEEEPPEEPKEEPKEEENNDEYAPEGNPDYILLEDILKGEPAYDGDE